MPFKSEAQRRWMHATHPAMAAKWEKHTPKHKKLPQHAHKSAHGSGVFTTKELYCGYKIVS